MKWSAVLKVRSGRHFTRSVSTISENHVLLASPVGILLQCTATRLTQALVRYGHLPPTMLIRTAFKGLAGAVMRPTKGGHLKSPTVLTANPSLRITARVRSKSQYDTVTVTPAPGSSPTPQVRTGD